MLRTIFISLAIVLFAANAVKAQVFAYNANIDSLLFAKINDYRVYNNVSRLEWDKDVYNMAKHHTTYQTLSQRVGHYEDNDVDNFDELETLDDRYQYYVGSERSKQCSENARGGNSIVVIVDTAKFAKFVSNVWDTDISDLTSAQTMVLYTVYRWSESPSHNTNMLSTFCTRGAVSIAYRDLKYIKHSLFHKGLPTVHFTSYSTMNYAK